MGSIELDEDRFPDSLPDNLRDGLAGHGWALSFPDESNEEAEPYQHAARGLCMMDGQPLGEHTIMLVDGDGVKGLFCQGSCLERMIVVTFLGNLIDELVG
jgi:hypothetical protein